MDKVTFYYQKRQDGGLRAGVDFNGDRVLERFEPGPQEEPRNSALLWFVDLRCAGEGLPSEPEELRKWFLDRSKPIQSALRQLAKDLAAGIESDWPLKRDVNVPGSPPIAI